ncbi:MAG: hypothetical protein HFE63_04115 [Clostridiales bacterium]|nr:hypothetical protein [Clostridiales bacterium]
MKDTFKNHKTVKLILILTMCMLIFTAAMVNVSAATVETNQITSIKLNKSKTDLQIDVALTKDYVKEHKSSTIYVFELLPYQSTSQINELEPVVEFKAGEKASVKIPYVNGNANRLYSKFVIAERLSDGAYNIIASAKYIENISILSENTESYPVTSSKKGLQIQNFTDAQRLGVQHTTINVALNEFILGENSSNAMSFVYNGQTYYLNKDKIALLDHRVKVYSEAGINVYLNIVLTAPDESLSDTVKSFYFDGALSGASLYALNTRNETAMKNFQAFMDYIAYRYTSPEHTYGFAPNFILGFEVNSNRTWNNAGAMDMESYVYSYCTAFRAAYTAMLSHYSEGRVYISLGNNFNSAAEAPGAESDPLYDYAAKSFLDFFNTAIKNSGDIPWGLAINPYPSDLSMTEFWNDSYAEDNFSTPFVTMKNLSVLTRYMNQNELLYNSKPRSIIISEFGVSGDPADAASMTMQSAAYALAYYAAAQNDDIDAFIYHRHVDHAGENLYYGLWSAVDGSLLEASAKKQIYNVFAQIDTENSEEATSFVKSLVGNGIYSLFIGDKVKFSSFNTRSTIDAIRADESDFEKGFGERVLFDLTKGSLCGFYPTDSADYVELRPLDDASTTMLYSRVSGTPLDYMGIGNLITEEGSFHDAQYITLRMMVTAPEGVSNLSFMLRLQSNDGADGKMAVYDGEVQLKPNEWTNVSFRIKDFVSLTKENIDSMKLWIKATDSASPEGEYGIWLENVVLHTKSGVSVIGVILWILLILVIIVVVGYGLLYMRAQYIRRKRREEMERRRRQQLRMQAMQQNRVMNPPPYAQNPNNNQRRDDFRQMK